MESKKDELKRGGAAVTVAGRRNGEMLVKGRNFPLINSGDLMDSL